jgi:hypothetical protein
MPKKPKPACGSKASVVRDYLDFAALGNFA